jgi:hypothetical protein
MNISDLTSSQLRQAADLKDQIEKLQKQITNILGTATPTATDGRKKKRTMSAAARALISAAQKKRWAARKRPTPVVPKPKAKSKMSPAAKALLSAKLKAYWAKRKAAKKK